MSVLWMWPLVVLVAAFAATLPVLWFASRDMRRLPADAHWSVVARGLWPFRVTLALAQIWIFMAACAYLHHELKVHGAAWLLVIVAIAAVVGCNLARRLATIGLRLPEPMRKDSLRSGLCRMLLAPGLPLMLLLMALTFERRFELGTWLIVTAVSLTGIFLVMGGSVMILRATGLLKPADPDLEQMARELASCRGVRVRHVFVCEMNRANAFAFPWTYDIGFTRAAIETLTPYERVGILRHEIGHLAEKRATRWIRLTGFFALLGLGLLPLVVANGGLYIGLLIWIGCFVVIRLVTRNHKKMEVAADQEAHDKEDEGAYARALEKIHQQSLIPAVLAKRHSYPSLYDRMTAAGVTPDFPRPPAPNRAKGIVLGAVAALVFILLLGALLDLVG